MKKAVKRTVSDYTKKKSVTRGKYITVPFNGREYYARYGDASTPLKIEKDGRTYSIQYEPVEFVSFSWGISTGEGGKYNKKCIFTERAIQNYLYIYRKKQ